MAPDSFSKLLHLNQSEIMTSPTLEAGLKRSKHSNDIWKAVLLLFPINNRATEFALIDDREIICFSSLWFKVATQLNGNFESNGKKLLITSHD